MYLINKVFKVIDDLTLLVHSCKSFQANFG